MKYIVIIGDGMADRPLRELGDKTPLEKAFTPNMDKLASKSTLGLVKTIPQGFPCGSDVANLSILGYDPRVFYTGRAPLEAASMGIDLKDNDLAFRCNLVTLRFNKEKTNAVMEDYSSGHISTEEATHLIKDINRELGSDKICFYPGISYRHLMVWAGAGKAVECVPPHDILGRDIADYQPVGDGEDILIELMRNSVDVLESHDINKKRIRENKNPANSIWLWGQGNKPALPTFIDKFGITGALVSAVDLTKGLGRYAGFQILNVPNVTGWLDTNYVGKAEYALEALEKTDFVYIHVEAPDEAGHSGSYKDKIKAIEDFDALVVGTVLRGLRAFDEYRILLMPDHATPVSVRTHTEEPVPFAVFDNRLSIHNEGAGFNESIAGRKDLLMFEDGYKLMDYFIKGEIF